MSSQLAEPPEPPQTTISAPVQLAMGLPRASIDGVVGSEFQLSVRGAYSRLSLYQLRFKTE
jgi:hypothetical protein